MMAGPGNDGTMEGGVWQMARGEKCKVSGGGEQLDADVWIPHVTDKTRRAIKRNCG